MSFSCRAKLNTRRVSNAARLANRPRPSLRAAITARLPATPYSTIPLEDFPSLDEIFSAPLVSAIRIPSAAKDLWARTYAKLLSNAVFHNDFRHWALVFMFEKVGLAAPPRAGKKNKNYLKNQIARWLADPIKLWRDHSVRDSSRKAPDNSNAARGRRAVHQVRNGLCARAVATLESGALVSTDPKARDNLLDKHPRS